MHRHIKIQFYIYYGLCLSITLESMAVNLFKVCLIFIFVCLFVSLKDWGEEQWEERTFLQETH